MGALLVVALDEEEEVASNLTTIRSMNIPIVARRGIQRIDVMHFMIIPLVQPMLLLAEMRGGLKLFITCHFLMRSILTYSNFKLLSLPQSL